MSVIKAGDYVGRKSYGMDIVFSVKRIIETESRGAQPGSAKPGGAKPAGTKPGTAIALLRAFEFRLMASAPLDDLVVLEPERYKEVISRSEENMSRKTNCCLGRRILLNRAPSLESGTESTAAAADAVDTTVAAATAPAAAVKDEPVQFPGRVLHIDGDQEYLDYCLKHYAKLGIDVYGVHVPESEQPKQVKKLIEQYQPDMIVMTGHDGYSRKKRSTNELEHYYHSKYFVEAVRNARLLRPDKDSLVIFAGACQSHYEAILGAGANFASSPERKLINCYDPVLVAEMVCFTPLGKTADIVDVIDNTITGREGIGGIETRGLMRTGLPAPVRSHQ